MCLRVYVCVCVCMCVSVCVCLCLRVYSCARVRACLHACGLCVYRCILAIVCSLCVPNLFLMCSFLSQVHLGHCVFLMCSFCVPNVFLALTGASWLPSRSGTQPVRMWCSKEHMKNTSVLMCGPHVFLRLSCLKAAACLAQACIPFRSPSWQR